LKRFLQRNVETKLARALITGEVGEGSDITFTVQNDELAPVQEAQAAKK
jgi:ATP-dependent Clp protease ATP-binding subunit ClpB